MSSNNRRTATIIGIVYTNEISYGLSPFVDANMEVEHELKVGATCPDSIRNRTIFEGTIDPKDVLLWYELLLPDELRTAIAMMEVYCFEAPRLEAQPAWLTGSWPPAQELPTIEDLVNYLLKDHLNQPGATLRRVTL